MHTGHVRNLVLRQSVAILQLNPTEEHFLVSWVDAPHTLVHLLQVFDSVTLVQHDGASVASQRFDKDFYGKNFSIGLCAALFICRWMA